MSVTNTLVTNEKKPFSQMIQQQSYQNLINSAIRDESVRHRFITTMVSAVSSNPNLQKCEAPSIISSALQGEALKLSPTLGEYAIVPYGNKWNSQKGDYESYTAQFQLEVSGMVQLAMRSGLYKSLNTIEIRKGEYKGKNFKGEPVIEFIEDDELRENLPIVGYYAYFELLNGFFKSIYFSTEKCIKWAERYSKTFDRKLFERFKNGEVTDWKEQRKCESPWYKEFDKMCEKTVLKQCLKFAPKSIEWITAEEKEVYNDADLSSVITPEETANDFFDGVDEGTGEIVEAPKKPTTRKKKTDNAEAEFFESK